MYAANNFGVSTKLSLCSAALCRLRLISSLIFRAVTPLRMYTWITIRRRRKCCIARDSSGQDAPRRYCDIIQRYDGASARRSVGNHDAPAYEIMDYRLSRPFWKSDFVFPRMLINFLIIMHAENDDQSLDNLLILNIKVFCSLSPKYYFFTNMIVLLFYLNFSINYFFIKNSLRTERKNILTQKNYLFRES